MITWQPCTVKLSDLRPWADNPRMSTKKQAQLLLDSWTRFGQVQTIAIGPDNEVYDGHQRLSALLTVHGNGYTVDARRCSRALSDEERRALVVTLHAGAVGSWDWDALSGWDAGELQQWGFDGDTLMNWQKDVRALGAMLSAEAEQPPDDPGAQVDKADELRQKWGVETGQLWKLGEHRLICGDCTDKAVVERVMCDDRAEMVWTDPPYGVSVGDKNKFLNSIARSNRIEENLENDTLAEPELTNMLCVAFDNAIEYCTAGAAWHVAAPPGPLHVIFGQILKDRGIWRQTIQWVKNNATFSPLGVCYHWRAEPIFFGWLPNGSHRYYGGRKQDTVWEIDRPTKSPEHPTMKPVELIERAIENHSRKGEIVLDMFIGSGTTIIACERLSRKCRAVEISPAYCAVAIQRWVDMTGGAPELVEQ